MLVSFATLTFKILRFELFWSQNIFFIENFDFNLNNLLIFNYIILI